MTTNTTPEAKKKKNMNISTQSITKLTTNIQILWHTNKVMERKNRKTLWDAFQRSGNKHKSLE